MAADQLSGLSFSVKNYFKPENLKKDFRSSIVVFLIALPLCLGIALASGAPLFAGILTGIIGGIVVGSLSGSQLSVSGPAAGLTVIVLSAIGKLGSFEAFLLAILLAGVFQIILGLLKAGTIANYFPSAVIEGMLAAIGIILILKQFPHAVGYDKDFEGDESFAQGASSNSFSAIGLALQRINFGAVIISCVSIAIMIYWPKIKKLNAVPGAMIVVVSGILMGILFKGTSLALQPDQLVTIPVIKSFDEFTGLFRSPDFSQIWRFDVWKVAGTIAVVASLETLLSLEAVDKIDPVKRVSPANRELVAQGIANMTSGMLGGMPMTSVIVRSSANVNSGAATKMSAILHGAWLLLSLLLIPGLINTIPLSCLAAILLITGYKLASPVLFKKMWKAGLYQFIPFIVTIIAVVLTDLLIGVGIGMALGIFIILRMNLRNPYFYKITKEGSIKIHLAEEVSFLNKAAIQYTLSHLPEESHVIIDGSNSRYIDSDVVEIIHNFEQNAVTRKITVTLINVNDTYDVPPLKEMVYNPNNFK